jgi:hypothetical protein
VQVALRGSQGRAWEPERALRSEVLEPAPACSAGASVRGSAALPAEVPREAGEPARRPPGRSGEGPASKEKREPNESKETSGIDDITSSRSITLRVCEVIPQARVAAIQRVFACSECFRNALDIDVVERKRDRTIAKTSRHAARVSGTCDIERSGCRRTSRHWNGEPPEARRRAPSVASQPTKKRLRLRYPPLRAAESAPRSACTTAGASTDRTRGT